MTFTANEIALSRRLHELLKAKGELPEIREGDWVDRENAPGEISLVLQDSLYFYNDPCYRDNFILLWSWERCREFLKERGWKIIAHADMGIEIAVTFLKSFDLPCKKGFGQTDAECALAVIVQIAEGEK